MIRRGGHSDNSSVLRLAEGASCAYQLAEMLESSTQAFALHFADARASIFNASFGTLLGYSWEELKSLDRACITPEEWKDGEERQLAALHRTGAPVRYEKEYLRKSGERVPVELHVNLHRSPLGQTDFIYEFVSDLSVRWRAQAVRDRLQLQELYQATLDGLSANIALLDDQGAILLVNKAWQAYAEGNGIAAEARAQMNYLKVCDDCLGYDYPEANAFAQGIRECLSGHVTSFSMEYPCHSPNVKRWFVGRVTPFVINGVRHVVVAHEDISDRKLSDELQGHIERMIQHDLRAPATFAIQLARLLRDGTDVTEEERITLLNQLEDAGENMVDTLNSSLELFKIETGKYQLSPVKVDCIHLLNKIIKSLTSGTRFSRIKLELLADGQPLQAETRCVCLGDPHLLHTALRNLLANALEASAPNGRVVAGVSSGNGGCFMEITNSGVVPAEIRDRFFDRYVTSGKSMGTGIGTYSARLMVRAQGGDISMSTSDATNETVVTVRMPCQA